MNRWFRLGAVSAICVLGTSCTQIYIASDSARTLNNAKKERVVVVFDTVEGKTCPVRVVALGSDCPPDLAGPETVCRDVGDGNSGKLKKVKWVRDDEAPGSAKFAIRFRPNENPCVEDDVTDLCNIKKNDHFKLDPGQSVILKYDVTSGDCPRLDPYIIVMR
jgi:hypothetical protein